MIYHLRLKKFLIYMYYNPKILYLITFDLPSLKEKFLHYTTILLLMMD